MKKRAMMRASVIELSLRHIIKCIGDDPRHKALRHRNEQRLAALKASNRLYEDKRESVASGNCPAASSANFEYQRALNTFYNQTTANLGNYTPGAALGSILGSNFFNDR